ncbi:chromosome segregation protein SMC [Candidatus Poribacteria bacterium]|nr:chromosome segregation protein SMC [Candidatus Poribacteria bacterium]
MYLKELELCGFKSFAHKTTLNLEKGISGVVGPNGCGKSNIGDAIRWVLGEQKMRVLRGQHMEDVIFSGSEDRHPLGMAEVSLVLDNSSGRLPLEYSEVSITRRLFRSGESEYYLNKLPCRRKDVVELLMGTGIGVDSYSLIEQGRIDLILSSKPEERRYIFEDAAGIMKYKTRKDAALRKMERADTNLLRLQDTIIEVRRRITSLKRQANAAQRYRQFRDDLRGLELRLALLKYRELDEEHNVLAARAKQLGDQLAEITARQSGEESDLEKDRMGMLELEKALSQARGHSRDLQSQIEKTESQIALLRERISAIDAREKRDIADIEELDRSLETQTHDRASTEEKEREATGRVSEAQRGLDEKEAQMAGLLQQLAAGEKAIEELRSLQLEKLNRKINLQNEINATETNIQSLSKRMAKLSERKVQVEQSVSQQENRLSETRFMIESLRAALASLGSELTSLNGTVAARHSELEMSVTRRDTARDSLASARSKLSSLEELRDKFEGYEDGVRAIMLAKQHGDARAIGVLGPLADLVRANKEHEAALEAALGQRLQNIVVEDLDAARLCVQLLESSHAGRASLIPLGSFPTNGHTAEPLSLFEAAGTRAIDLAHCDERIRPVIEKLLGSTFVVESLDAALALAPSLDPRRDLVTLRGEAISSVGIITAGDTGKGRGLLGRKNEIEELRDSIGKNTAVVETENAKIASLKNDIEQCHGLIQKLRTSVGSHEVELAKAERDQQQLSAGKQRDEQECDVLEQERLLTAHESQELAKQQQYLMLRIEQARIVEAETQEELKGAGVALGEFRNRKDVLAAEIADFKVNLSSLQLTCQTFKREIHRLEADMLETARRISEKRNDVAEGARTRAAFANEIEDSRSAIQRIFEQKRTLDADIEKTDEQRRELFDRMKALDDSLKKTRALAHDVGAQHHQTEIALAQNEEKISFLKEKTIADYRLSMSEIAQEITVEENFDPQAAADEAQRLRSKIESIGPVNLIAIEEFEELQQRYNFLIQQEADLRKAKEALLGIIKKINETTQTMFMETFEQIHGHFHEIFRNLFGGGRATVQLIDPLNPLESGIEISVHPPGKKAQSISLLSGGEKALTAIALLFAIFKSRPSPFCVLDEVDAALDDSNILRFTRLVKMFSSDVQFIVVTHNKRTMELADVLYGVTMEERGVSQIVSVKFKKTSAFEFLEPSVAS